MADIQLDKEEKPLDPAAERLRRKLVRLIAVSIGTMFIAVFAVLFAIVYKINNAETDNTIVETTVDLPDGFDVKSVEIEDNLLIFYGNSAQNGAKLLFFDKNSGTARGKVNLR